MDFHPAKNGISRYWSIPILSLLFIHPMIFPSHPMTIPWYSHDLRVFECLKTTPQIDCYPIGSLAASDDRGSPKRIEEDVKAQILRGEGWFGWGFIVFSQVEVSTRVEVLPNGWFLMDFWKQNEWFGGTIILGNLHVDPCGMVINFFMVYWLVLIASFIGTYVFQLFFPWKWTTSNSDYHRCPMNIAILAYTPFLEQHMVTWTSLLKWKYLQSTQHATPIARCECRISFSLLRIETLSLFPNAHADNEFRTIFLSLFCSRVKTPCWPSFDVWSLQTPPDFWYISMRLRQPVDWTTQTTATGTHQDTAQTTLKLYQETIVKQDTRLGNTNNILQPIGMGNNFLYIGAIHCHTITALW